jgi:hypothetical protein
MDKPQKLPIGIQTFEEIIKEGYLYVDKTRFLIDLIDSGKVYFLSRPRRFGKSLTVSTFEAIFSGKKELFKGLAAEEFFERPGYEASPVIWLDMSKVVTDRGVQILDSSMLMQVASNADRMSVKLSELATQNPAMALSELMRLAAKNFGRSVAVLVDEYDKPILDFIDQPDKAEEARTTLRSFYTQIKSSDQDIRFVFITGITKFSKMGVFSAMNNLRDISMTNRYATMLGYTEDELVGNFGPHIEQAAKNLDVSPEKLLERMKNYYDGFSFDGNSRLYNPFSTLNFFDEAAFKNFWFESGTPSYIAKLMKDRHLPVEEFRGVEVGRDFAAYPGEIENADAVSFLYQSGYLSLRPGVADDYSLDYPNREVLSSMSSLLAENILGSRAEAENSRQSLRQCLMTGDANGVVEELNRLLASIPYDDYSRAAMDTVKRKRLGMNAGEWLFRSTILSYLIGMGLDVDAEPHSSAGRADIRIKFKERVWIIEIKVARGESTGKTADEAMKQIISKDYAARYRRATLLAIAIDDERRCITEYRVDMRDN